MREALLAEGRRGLELAGWARLAALAVVDLWLLVTYPESWALFLHGAILGFALLGLAEIAVARRGRAGLLLDGLVVADALLLVAVLLLPNPLLAVPPPAALPLRYDNFVFFFVFLASFTFAHSARLLLTFSLTGAVAWLVGVAWIVGRPDVTSELDPVYRAMATTDGLVRAFLDPGHVHLANQVKQVLVLVMVGTMLALAARRMRGFLRRQLEAERARTNLARYLPSALVEQFAGRDAPFGPVRRQEVVVLFADLRGFTRLCEEAPPERVISWLRQVLGELEHVTFRHGGTLDKFLGDGLLATFGTTRPTPEDADRALACALEMIETVGHGNRARIEAGDPALDLALGLHAGPAVLGDIGSERRVEFTVLGDTVNVASRLEALCRDLDASLVVSADFVARLTDGDRAAAAAGLIRHPPTPIPGRGAPIVIWTRRRAGEDRASAAGPDVAGRPQ